MNRALAPSGFLAALCFSALAWPFNAAESPSDAARSARRFLPYSSASAPVTSAALPPPEAPVSVLPPRESSAEPAVVPTRVTPSPWPLFRGGFELSIQEIPGQMFGDAPTILSRLGLSAYPHDDTVGVPRLGVSAELSTGAQYSLGVDLGLSWMSASISSSGSGSVQYKASRSLVPLDVQGHILLGSPRFSFFLMGGFLLGVSRFQEEGWLGDSSSLGPLVGVVFRSGVSIRLGRRVFMPLGFFSQGYLLPESNPLLSDGGTTGSKGAFLGLYFSL